MLIRASPQCQRTYDDDADFCPRDGTRLVRVAKPSDADLAASLASRYRLVRKLCEGGMGSVLLAEQIAVGHRPVALKVLLKHLLNDPQFLMRFQTEAAVTGRIRHPNVVTIYESGQTDDGTLYIAMEYLEGQTLHEMLESGGLLSLLQAAAIVQQTARGLNAAHKLGIVHRDLKPSNIFLIPADDVGAGLPSRCGSPAGFR